VEKKNVGGGEGTWGNGNSLWGGVNSEKRKRAHENLSTKNRGVKYQLEGLGKTSWEEKKWHTGWRL